MSFHNTWTGAGVEALDKCPGEGNAGLKLKYWNISELIENCKIHVFTILCHSRDVHPMWVKLFTKTLSNKGSRVLSTKSKEDLGSF